MCVCIYTCMHMDMHACVTYIPRAPLHTNIISSITDRQRIRFFIGGLMIGFLITLSNWFRLSHSPTFDPAKIFPHTSAITCT